MTEVLAGPRLADVLGDARRKGASDVHLVPGLPPAYRIDGTLSRDEAFPATADEVTAIASRLLDETARNEYEVRGDATAALRDDRAGAIRIHAYRTAAGMALSIRLLSSDVPAIETLELPPIVRSFGNFAAGLVIFAGPTGSGKSTALAALVGDINLKASRHVITIEDPIEYYHKSNRSMITQRSVGRDVQSFADAIYGALRSDPDVLLIGEMRNAATMRAALNAAETGHLVLSTLHTNTAPETIDRIIANFGAAAQAHVRTQLAQCLSAVICLRLLPRANGRGRVPAAEVLVATDAVRHVIREGKTHHLHNILATSREAGMSTFRSSIDSLVANGIVAPGFADLP